MIDLIELECEVCVIIFKRFKMKISKFKSKIFEIK